MATNAEDAKEAPEAGLKRRNPAFSDLNLSPHDALSSCERVKCPGRCEKKRRYFCSECVIPLVHPPEAMPRVQLPLHIDILQSAAETPQRSTAQHVPLLAPGCARVWRPFPECADTFCRDVLDGAEEGSVAVLYPSEGALTPAEAAEQLPRLRRVVVLDASWTKSVLLLREGCLSGLPRVTLPAGVATRFWRYAPKRSEHSEYFSPDKVGALVSTVEAVHRFCDAFHIVKGGALGEMDNLLWLFAFLHGRVREVYEQAPGKRQRILRKSKGLLLDRF